MWTSAGLLLTAQLGMNFSEIRINIKYGLNVLYVVDAHDYRGISYSGNFNRRHTLLSNT